jgi:hypothetical protein
MRDTLGLGSCSRPVENTVDCNLPGSVGAASTRIVDIEFTASAAGTNQQISLEASNGEDIDPLNNKSSISFDVVQGVTAGSDQDPNQEGVSRFKVAIWQQKYRRINAKCGIKSFRVAAVGPGQSLGGKIYVVSKSESAPDGRKFSRKVITELGKTGVLIPVRVCKEKKFKSRETLWAGFVDSTNGSSSRSLLFYNKYVFNWQKKRWTRQ